MLLACTGCGNTTASISSATEETASSFETLPSSSSPETELTPAYGENTASGIEESLLESSLEVESVAQTVFPLYEEPTTYTIWVTNSPDLSDIIKDFSDFTVISEMEKLTNLHWDATLVSYMASTEAFGLMVASQDYTDVVSGAVSNYSGGADAAVEADFLIDLSEYVAADMPNLTRWLEEYPDLRKAVVSNDGYICAFPKINDPDNALVGSGMLRKDWLEDLDMEVPTTFGELHDVLVAFRDDLGAETPMQIADPTGVQLELLSGYNIMETYYQVDGEVRFGAIQPEFKDYIQMVKTWYDEGLIDPNFVNQSMDIMTDYSNVLSGKTGVWYTCNLSNISILQKNAADPAFTPLSFCNVTVNGERNHCSEVQSIFNQDSWAITTACRNPEDICKYVDYLYSEDGIVLCNYGVEGYTYEYDEAGNRVLTDVVLNNPDYSYSLALNIFTCDMQTQVPYVIDSEKETSNYNELQWECYNSCGINADGDYALPKAGADLTTDETQEYNSIYSDIETYLDECVAKFITGAEPLSEYDHFVETLKQMGIERCVELKQAAYDRYLVK